MADSPVALYDAYQPFRLGEMRLESGKRGRPVAALASKKTQEGFALRVIDLFGLALEDEVSDERALLAAIAEIEASIGLVKEEPNLVVLILLSSEDVLDSCCVDNCDEFVRCQFVLL